MQARLEAAEEAVEAASGWLAQVAEVSAEPVQLTASVDELRSKMASTPWTQDSRFAEGVCCTCAT